MLSFEVRKSGGESEIRKVHRDVIHIGASTGNDLVVRARGVLGRHARAGVALEAAAISTWVFGGQTARVVSTKCDLITPTARPIRQRPHRRRSSRGHCR